MALPQYLETKSDLGAPGEIFVFRCPANFRSLAGILVGKPAPPLGFEASSARHPIDKPWATTRCGRRQHFSISLRTSQF
jgi:hypothetical protein